MAGLKVNYIVILDNTIENLTVNMIYSPIDNIIVNKTYNRIYNLIYNTKNSSKYVINKKITFITINNPQTPHAITDNPSLALYTIE